MNTRYPTIAVKTVNQDTVMPRYAHDGDAGLDLCVMKDVTLHPGEWTKVGSGIAVAIPKGYVGLVYPRSGLGCKGLVLKNGTGVIDSGYRGEIGLTLFNNNPTHWWHKFHNLFLPERHTGKEPKGTIHVRKGDRVAQLVIQQVCQATLVEADELEESERGTGGFGSTGITGGPRP